MLNQIELVLKKEGTGVYLDKIKALIKSYEEDEDVMDICNRALNSFAQYLEVVTNTESFIMTRSVLYGDTDQYQQSVMNLDRNRKAIHDGVITNVAILNRLAKQAGLPIIYEGPTDNRSKIGDFAGDIAKEIFDNRKK